MRNNCLLWINHCNMIFHIALLINLLCNISCVTNMIPFLLFTIIDLGNEGGCRGSLIFPDGGELTSSLIIASKTMDTAFDQNKTVLAILIFSITFKMLTDSDSLFNQTIKIFRDLGSQSYKITQVNVGTLKPITRVKIPLALNKRTTLLPVKFLT